MSQFRILSYNVHACIGTDRHHSPERVARVIASCRPDIVALQEIDVGRERTGGIDQAHTIATLLGMQSHFNGSTQIGRERYGDAILTALPMTVRRAGRLPGFHDRIRVEPRGALWAEIEVGTQKLQVVNTHLGVWPQEQTLQLKTLLGPDWLGHPDCRDPVVFVGDFNAPPALWPYRRLASQFTDVQKDWGARVRATYPGRMPTLRLDHVWLRGRAEVKNVEVVRTPLARVASDHLPLVVDIDIHDSVSRVHGRRVAAV